MPSTPEHQPFLKYSDDPAAEEASPPQQHVQRRTALVSHILVFVGTSVVWVLVMLFVVPSSKIAIARYHAAQNGMSWHERHNITGGRHNITTGRRLVSCGNSTTEARAQGCKYDILLNHWVPAPCFDKDSVDEYQEDNSWGAFADTKLTQKLTIDEMSERDFYWTSTRDHINHCAIMWRRQYYALFDQRAAVDSIITSPGHTEHCSQYLMDVVDARWTDPTKTMRGFAGCWILD
ncbi:uncharacterized protein CTRU02_214301 [Colletotrichum truncatum]|uniref:Uncharacterized protein n=1 Tax=Colletotrichum truncatum TaxID=5467 RepID=A0ACC3YIP3_COLTU|nr:uncharacterized protein CTRU02_11371 [Colletotrichum truncatum]KAF6786113.1 hypothetical protein CTRU02_11371 [Colletotrichum truncatum]